MPPHRVNKVTDVVKEGDKVKVKLLGVDERGKVRLSMKAVDQATGEDLEGKQRAEGGEQPQAAQAARVSSLSTKQRAARDRPFIRRNDVEKKDQRAAPGPPF